MLLLTVMVRCSNRTLLGIILMILRHEKPINPGLTVCPSETSSPAEAKSRNPEGSSISSEADGTSYFYSLMWKQKVYELTKRASDEVRSKTLGVPAYGKSRIYSKTGRCCGFMHSATL